MKKLLSFTITLTMALSVSLTALAADINQDTQDKNGTTNVNFNIDPTYTVNIPATVTLTKDSSTGNYKQDAKITAKDVRLEEGKNIKVKFISDFKLTTGAVNTTYELPYTVKVEDNSQVISSGDVVSTFTTNIDEQTSILHFEANNPTYAGNYSDIVTFNISVE